MPPRPPQRLPLFIQPPAICRRCLSPSRGRPLLVRFAFTSSSSDSGPPPSPRPSSLSQRTAEYVDSLQVRALAASQRLNDITGYSSIESIKSEIQDQDVKARAAREAVTKAKEEYNTAVTTRAETQRELTNLLNRKTSWTPEDLARFTQLYPSDHENELRVSRAAEGLSRAERESEEVSAELGRLILSRYHEEQIWSDKIRRASTWGTFALMGVNVLLFVVVQVGLEPWRRKRLVRGFEEKVREAVTQIPQQAAPVATETVTIEGLEALEEGKLDDITGITTNDAESEAVEAAGIPETEKIEVEDREREFDTIDVLISAASGAVVGGLVTALTTWLISR